MATLKDTLLKKEMLAVQLRYGDQPLGAVWFLELRWSWVGPVAGQRLGGALVAVAAAVMLVLAVLRLRRRPSGDGAPAS